MSSKEEFHDAFLIVDIRDYIEFDDIITLGRVCSAGDYIRHNDEAMQHYLSSLKTVETIAKYIDYGKKLFLEFGAVKLQSLNMLHLEDDLSLDIKDMSDEELMIVIEKALEKRSQRNKTNEKYPYGTAVPFRTIKRCMRDYIYRRGESSKADPCSICLKDFVDDDMIFKAFNCPHEFHQECIRRWIPNNPSCPLCRKWMLSPQVEYPSWINDVEYVRKFLTRNPESLSGYESFTVSKTVLPLLVFELLKERGWTSLHRDYVVRLFFVTGKKKLRKISKHVQRFIEEIYHFRSELAWQFGIFVKCMLKVVGVPPHLRKVAAGLNGRVIEETEATFKRLEMYFHGMDYRNGVRIEEIPPS